MDYLAGGLLVLVVLLVFLVAYLIKLVNQLKSEIQSLYLRVSKLRGEIEELLEQREEEED
jgi:uncharacterized protein YoxC